MWKGLQFMKTLYDTHACNIRLLVKTNIRDEKKSNGLSQIKKSRQHIVSYFINDYSCHSGLILTHLHTTL